MFKNIIKALLVLSLTVSLTGCNLLVMLKDGKVDNSFIEQDDDDDISNSKEMVKNTYFYDQMTSDEKKVYDDIYNNLSKQNDSFDVKTRGSDYDRIMEIYYQVICDCPDLFFVAGSVTSQMATSSILIEPEYIFDASETAQFQSQLDTIVDDYLKEIDGLEIKDILDYTHDYITQNVEFNNDAAAYSENTDYYSQFPYASTVVGGLIDNSAICGGYAHTFQYLMNYAGYQCQYLSGIANGGLHAWDALKIDNQYYYFDLTWDDLGDDSTYFETYAYYGLDYNQISLDHEVENFSESESDTSYNYAVLHEYYLDSIDNYSTILNSQYDGSIMVIQCSTKSLYDEVYKKLITEGEYTSYISTDSMNYIEYPDLYMLYIFPKDN